MSLPGLWDAERTSARPGSGGRGGSGAPIWAGWASPQWAPPPAPSVWPGDAPPPARHAVYLQAVTYFSDSAGPEWGSGCREKEAWERQRWREVMRTESFISARAEIVRQGRVSGHGLVYTFKYPYLCLLLIMCFLKYTVFRNHLAYPCKMFNNDM